MDRVVLSFCAIEYGSVFGLSNMALALNLIPILVCDGNYICRSMHMLKRHIFGPHEIAFFRLS